jgi:hypothetical protein
MLFHLIKELMNHHVSLYHWQQFVLKKLQSRIILLWEKTNNGVLCFFWHCNILNVIQYIFFNCCLQGKYCFVGFNLQCKYSSIVVSLVVLKTYLFHIFIFFFLINYIFIFFIFFFFYFGILTTCIPKIHSIFFFLSLMLVKKSSIKLHKLR